MLTDDELKQLTVKRRGEVTPEFNRWWGADELTQTNPYTEETPVYWAWEGWRAAKRDWVGLTDEERHSIREWQEVQKELGPVWAPTMLYLYLAIEAKLKEKNT